MYFPLLSVHTHVHARTRTLRSLFLFHYLLDSSDRSADTTDEKYNTPSLFLPQIMNAINHTLPDVHSPDQCSRLSTTMLSQSHSAGGLFLSLSLSTRPTFGHHLLHHSVVNFCRGSWSYYFRPHERLSSHTSPCLARRPARINAKHGEWLQVK